MKRAILAGLVLVVSACGDGDGSGETDDVRDQCRDACNRVTDLVMYKTPE